MHFEFATATKIIFGPGTIKAIGDIALKTGNKALLVTGSGGASPDRIMDIFSSSKVSWETVEVVGEPTIELIEKAIVFARQKNCDYVVSYGGGSVIDTGKAISAMITNKGELLDYLEVIGGGKSITNRAAHLIAIPTTSGTGSEVTRNAVLSAPDRKRKVSMRSPLMIASTALVDPELTYSLPPAVTASTGMDALTQVLEPYVSKKANSFTDLYCLEGMKRAARSLLKAYTHGDDREAREDMAFTSLLGGLALANAGLGAAHGFAAAIGGMFKAPHGALCARVLPSTVKTNILALRERMPESPILDRYLEIARILAGNPSASFEDGIEFLQALITRLEIPSLSEYGIKPSDIPILVENAAVASSMQANPIQLTKTELSQMLESAL
ncbi:MAG TPA: iron-containing alcohol dehydrogenase [Anaerolineaceae bacterium]|nr:iron-containing alcohol dehydrogenase [Anaerolineaceae bacterium]